MNMSWFNKLAGRVMLPLLCAALLLGSLTGYAQAVETVTARLCPDYTIVIDGTNRIFYNVNGQQVHPIAYNGTTYLPLRAIGELMGKVVTWDKDTRTASLGGVRTGAATAGTPDTDAMAQNVTVELRNDITVVVDDAVRTFADANGKTVYPLSYQGSTYLPIRAIGELMGKSVAWDGKTSTVTLSGSSGGEITDADVIVGGGTSPSGGQGVLTLEDAKAKALSHAGAAAENAIFAKEKLDWDDGRQVYEFEFYVGDYEYDYELDAKTGEILSSEQEAVKSGTPAASGTITREKAQEIALAKVPGAKAEHIVKLDLDRDDGRMIYEVEIIYNNKEYDLEISAADGKILKFESESVHH